MSLRPDNMQPPSSVDQVATASTPAVDAVVVESPEDPPSPAPSVFEKALAAMRFARRRERIVARAMRALAGRGGLKAFRKVADAKIRGEQPIMDQLLCEVGITRETGAAKFLLGLGANPNATDVWNREGMQVLLPAVAIGPIQMVRLLIKHGAKLENGSNEESLLGVAARRGDVAIMREVLALGADPNGWGHLWDWDVTPLMIAIAEANTACIEVLARSGADVNYTCCHMEAIGGYSSRPSTHGLRPCRPLDLAEATCNAAAARILRSFGALRLAEGTGDTAASYRAPERFGLPARNLMRRALRLIVRGARMTEIRSALGLVRNLDEFNGCLLEAACLARRIDVIGHLVELGADPNAVCRYELPQLTGGSIVSARMLLEHGYDQNDRSYSGPLLAAVRHGDLRLLALLVARGVKISANPISPAKADNGEELPEYSALMHAVAYDEIGCAAFLLSHGADPNLSSRGFPRPENAHLMLDRIARRDFYPPTWMEAGDSWERCGGVLHVAVITGNLRLVRLLLSRGADPCAVVGLDDYLEQVRPRKLKNQIGRILRRPRPALSMRNFPGTLAAGVGKQLP